jgi:hypothetical protein
MPLFTSTLNCQTLESSIGICYVASAQLMYGQGCLPSTRLVSKFLVAERAKAWVPILLGQVTSGQPVISPFQFQLTVTSLNRKQELRWSLCLAYTWGIVQLRHRAGDPRF